MTRTLIPTRDSAPVEARPVFEKVYKKLGFVPNLFRLLSLAPNVLLALDEMQQKLDDSFDIRIRAQVALAVSEMNTCLYCLASHSYIVTNFSKMYPKDVVLARQGLSMDQKLAAVGSFVKRIIETRGHVKEEELRAFRDYGFTNSDVLTIIGLVVQYTFTNYVNNVFDTRLDFPKVSLVKLN